jgi:ATP-dependent Clp protease ATP-binding subunit ClpB
LAKALAEFLFDDEKAMVRIDMSEYGERHAVARLIGAPPGYVGYEEGGQLTEPVRRRPYTVVLFDEIEKAHPDVWNVLLQVLDDGRLTDGQGHTVDFKNTILILTSNLGTAAAMAVEDRDTLSASDKTELVKRVVLDEVRKNFRPEFLNRFDDIVVFRKLERAQLEKIVDIQLGFFEKRLARRGLSVSMTPGAKLAIIESGWDPQYGARPLKRAIQRLVEDELAKRILAGDFKTGDTIAVNRGAEGLTFSKVTYN